jgi:type II secretory pathway pseudopilin PulG
MAPAGKRRRIGSGGFTLIEATITMAVVTAIVTASLGARYYAVQQARRGDAYNGAGRVGLLLLEGWRSTTTPAGYDPVAQFTSKITISTSATGPATPSGFTKLGSYHVLLDNVHYYATLAYINATATAPTKLHVCVGWKPHFEAGDMSSSGQYVRLTTYD